MVARGHTSRMCMADLPGDAYERAFGHAESRIHGREVLRYGGPGRVHDSVNIPTWSMAVMPEQADQWNRDWGHLGKWSHRTGKGRFHTRRSKIAYMAANGYHDRDEVCG